MDEVEVPDERLQEHIEHAHHQSGERWLKCFALSSALLAVLAAVTALLSGHHAIEAMIEPMKATDQWSFFQAKSIKAAILEGKLGTFSGLGKETSDQDFCHLF